MEDLVRDIATETFPEVEPVELRNSGARDISLHELKIRFVQDIHYYLAWIQISLAVGVKPKPLEKGGVFLDISTAYYKQAFRGITHKRLNPDTSGLSMYAASMLASYINVCLINRNLNDDV